ncbi:MAG: DUF4097 domain-containing protein [Defluviitaleaceae bacterium]|nr:DUF4097 domain-containing protein [Defluviitaleaceae bacterium]
MKKSAILVLSILVITIGTVLFFISRNNTNHELVRINEILTEFSSIDVDLNSTDLNIISVDSSNFRLLGQIHSDGLNWSVQDDTLTLSEPDRINVNILNAEISSPKITLEVPRGFLEEAEIKTISGYVNITNMLFNRLYVDIISGDLTLTDVNANIFEAKSLSGDTLSNRIISENININVTSGDVRLNLPYGRADYDYTTNTLSGDVSITGVQEAIADIIRNIHITTVSGDIYLNFLGLQ